MAPKSKWFVPINNPARTTLRLICIPYSGGSATIFNDWPKYLPPTIQVLAVQFPGRGPRFTESLIDDLDEMVAAIRAELKPFSDRPLALFGHSLGAAIAYELARLLPEDGAVVKYLFPSARRAPHFPKEKAHIHHLPHDEFVEELKQMGGTPPEILAHKELMELMLPIIRADFKMSEVYQHESVIQVACPVAAFGSKDDPETTEPTVQGWDAYAENAVVHFLPGDHFYMHTAIEQMLGIIRDCLEG